MNMRSRANTLEAKRVIYPKTWTAGEWPIVEDLGTISLPVNWHDDDAERMCRKAFPTANGYTAYDELGQAAIIAINLL